MAILEAAGLAAAKGFTTQIGKLAADHAVRTLSPEKAARRSNRDNDCAHRMAEILNVKGHCMVQVRGGDNEFEFSAVVMPKNREIDISNEMATELSQAFQRSGMHDFLAERLKGTGAYIKRAQKESGSTTNAMQALFGAN